MNDAQRIDVHQHVVPPFWSEQLPLHGGDPSGWHSPAWSPDAALAFMDRQQIATGVLSLTAPGVQGWQGEKRRDMARRVNDYTAALADKHPDRFGHFATVPLPDVEGAIAEVEYAFDSLHADGVVLLTNYDGRYLGSPEFTPLWKALDRRSATVFIHPSAPSLPVLDGLPGPVVDYPFDTTRTAVHMAHNGVMDRTTRTKIILSHAGGFLPYASHRFAELLAALHPEGRSVEGYLEAFKRFYFDTALSGGAAALPSLMAFAAPGHVLYGSDFPYAPAAVGASFTAQLDSYASFSPDERVAINREAARQLFDRFA